MNVVWWLAVIVSCLCVGVALYALGLHLGWWGPHRIQGYTQEPAAAQEPAVADVAEVEPEAEDDTARETRSFDWGGLALPAETNAAGRARALALTTQDRALVWETVYAGTEGSLQKARAVRIYTMDSFSLDNSGRQVVTLSLGSAQTYTAAFVQFSHSDVSTSEGLVGMDSCITSSMSMIEGYTASEVGDIWLYVTEDYTQSKRMSGTEGELPPLGFLPRTSGSLALLNSSYADLGGYLIGVQSDYSSYFEKNSSTGVWLEAAWIENNNVKLVFQNDTGSLTDANRVALWALP